MVWVSEKMEAKKNLIKIQIFLWGYVYMARGMTSNRTRALVRIFTSRIHVSFLYVYKCV